MLNLFRTDSTNEDFISLVKLLDADLRIRDGEDHAFYAQFYKIDKIRNAVVAYLDGITVACGAIKPYTGDTAEVKRMFVHPDFRRKGIAADVLKELETWAKELGFKRLILETGKAQPEAIHLYIKNNYTIIPNYGQYENVVNSVCMEKILQ